ncbi:MAG: ABC transporter ATP-binding protein [Gammaproteobacteria bacterium]|nr:ABC transporter ATP-binding protein [Gammaproteobacteria bacterium]
MSHIRIDNIHKSFGPVEVLKGIDLELAQGSVLALLGPSGCGKTTLLRLIAGFDPVDEGRIRFGEQLMASAMVFVPPERRRIGYVPQEGALFPHLTVEGNLAYGLPKGANRKQRISEVLELIGLQDFGHRYPHELSGGQQQRVALGRALAPDPQLVLLDEPFNALDLELRRSMCEDVIALLRKTGTTAILVTHDPGEAFAVSDQLAVMMHGQIMQCAPPETIYWQPASETVARLTGDAIFMPGQCTDNGMRCALGVIPLHGSCPVPQRGEPTLVVRPEQFHWCQQCEGVPATVTRRSFRGDHTLIEVEIEGMCLSLRMPSLTTPQLGESGHLRVLGKCMAWA